MIYALIAGTYTPLALLVLDAGWQLPILTVVWGGAVASAAARSLGRTRRPGSRPRRPSRSVGSL